MIFNVGDRVVVKSWEEMKSEFGLKRGGNIDCEFVFTTDMKMFCHKEFTITNIVKVPSGRMKILGLEEVDTRAAGFTFGADMLRLCEGSEIEESELLASFLSDVKVV